MYVATRYKGVGCVMGGRVTITVRSIGALLMAIPLAWCLVLCLTLLLLGLGLALLWRAFQGERQGSHAIAFLASPLVSRNGVFQGVAMRVSITPVPPTIPPAPPMDSVTGGPKSSIRR